MNPPFLICGPSNRFLHPATLPPALKVAIKLHLGAGPHARSRSLNDANFVLRDLQDPGKDFMIPRWCLERSPEGDVARSIGLGYTNMGF
jgi:hypothetical protein